MTRPERRRRGANAIEFALTLPVLLLVVSGVFDWSWLAYQRTALKSAVSAGCRAASLIDPGQDDAALPDLQERATDVTLDALEVYGASGPCAEGCDVSVDLSGAPPGRVVRCTVAGRFRPVWGLYVGSQPLAVSDLDRLAWQRWSTR